ncbi:MAG: choice-of-anchor B family protein [Thermoanaerobaculia bacterium]
MRRLALICLLALTATAGDSQVPPDSSCCGHACQPATYQGCGCGSISCFPGGDRLTRLEPDRESSRALAALTGPAACVDGLAAGTFPCRGVDLAAFVPLEAMSPGTASGSSLWGFASLQDGREYAVFGASSGTAVIEVTDPARPVVVGFVPGPTSLWREVKVYQFWSAAERRYRAVAYVTSEAPTAGLQILDLSNLPWSVSPAATFREFDTAHTVTVANVDPATGAKLPGGPEPVLYVQGARNPTVGIHALDIANPVAPAVLGRYTFSYGHDIWTGRFAGARASACAAGHDPCDIVVNWAGNAIRVLDWTDKGNPIVIQDFAYPSLGYAHSGWIARDGRYLFSMDETEARTPGNHSRVRVFDASSWNNLVQAGEWAGDNPAIPHNGYTKGDAYVIAHYERGLTILDVTDPRSPVERAFFDTYPSSNTANYHGAWGVYPYLPSGTILLSNMDGAGGLFVLREAAPPASSPRGPVQRSRPRPAAR